MRAQSNCFTVICKHHHDIDVCDPWSEFVVIVNGVADASQAAVAACKRLVKDNGGKAGATMVIAGKPELSFPEGYVFDSEQDDLSDHDCTKVSSYRELS